MGRRKFKKLTQAAIRALKEPGRYGDGDGLYLVVDREFNKRWMLRIMVHGRRRDIGLGPLRRVSLAEARAKCGEIRAAIDKGEDPLAVKRRAREIPRFDEYARKLHEAIKGEFRNEKHAAQWLRSMELHAFPALGAMRLDLIDSKAVREALLPIWFEKRETARRVRQRIGRVLDAAASEGLRSGENPVLSAMRGLPRNGEAAGHFKALAYVEVPAFVRRLRAENMTPAAKLAFEFLILTAARTSEVLLARRSEIDVHRALWTIPGERMKAGREHKVPLTGRALAILEQAGEMGGDRGALIFPSQKGGEPFSNGVFLAALKRMKVEATPHGFRSAFRDWAEEMTVFSHEVKEAALAHVVKNKAEAAYRRTDLLEKRRELMKEWADYCGGRAGVN